MIKEIKKCNKKNFEIKVDETLHYLWDPIGISNEPSARDEYYEYSKILSNMIFQYCTEKDIIEYLLEIETKIMLLPKRCKKAKKIAKIIMKWKNINIY